MVHTMAKDTSILPSAEMRLGVPQSSVGSLVQVLSILGFGTSAPSTPDNSPDFSYHGDTSTRSGTQMATLRKG